MQLQGYTSQQLTLEHVYTRDDLRRIFGIIDATLNTGVFRPKGTSSIWLFITEEKTSDRTQYRDRLEGQTLYWQGQSSGRTDALILEHQPRGLELLVFFRRRKYEHPGAGFRYLGPFAYVSHSGNFPTSFVLTRQSQEMAAIRPEDADDEAFDPSGVDDARQRVLRSISRRRGQRAFRDALMSAYGGRCAMTGCTVADVLEAAHIYPYRGTATNALSNGLLLRADLHTLFDCGLIAIDAISRTILVSPRLKNSEYGELHGRKLRSPQTSAQLPGEAVLDMHRASAGL
ncbi:protein of unknown function [Pseudorhizobium banfieldiae]|uniref:Uncharacterized protein n=1 Tax=Pseudorhizobium banfieldiae TaxID=1125847 RepID=L0NL94_9HYPH|nr:protein of unknown function [Pseudorhizobium banfieldiae]